MKNMMMVALGVAVGMVLAECKCVKKPMKACLKKINIE
jgi:hypothetical protein